MTEILWSPSQDNAQDGALVARRFGADLADLSVNFASPLDDTLTALLAACLRSLEGERFPPTDVHAWTVAKRRQGLLAVSAANSGTRRDVPAICPDDDCNTRLDLEVDLTVFRQDWRIETVDVLLPDGSELSLRHPTPADLAATGVHDTETDLAVRLLKGDPPPGEWIDQAQAALSAAAPLAALELQGCCSECGAPVRCPVMLEPFLLRELATASAVLMDEIHVLALGYHWSEAEIMTLPEGRRRHYLARIQEAWAA